MTRTTIFIAIASAVAALALAASTAPEGHAQPAPKGEPAAPSADDLEKAKAAFAKGSEEFAANNFAEAVKSFKESYRLSRNPLLLYNIAVTFEALGDKDLALFYYKKFLSDSPKDVVNRKEAKASAEAIIAESEPTPPKVDPKDPKDPKDGAKPKGPKGFEHNVVTEAPPGHPLDMTAFAPKAVGWKIYLFFRVAGAAKFTQVEMKPRYSELVARIPAKAMSGSTIQYYVEARDIGDELVARSGKPTSPHVVLIEEGVKPRFYPDLEDDPSIEIPTNPGKDDAGPRTMMTYAKWGTTGAAVGFVTLSASFLLIAKDASSGIEGSAFESNQEDCAQGRPCRPFGDNERSLQSRGERFELLTNVFFGLGVTAGIAAGVLWYLDSRPKKTDKSTSITATPAVGPDFVGGAATVRF